MVKNLKLPPKLIFEDMIYIGCPDCINLIWCKKDKYSILIFYLSHVTGISEIGIMTVAPCSVYKYKDSVIIGICLKNNECMNNPCSYCPELSEKYCKIHDSRYFNNSYFKGNGICCNCLDDFRKNNNMKENEKVYMVRK